MAPITTKAEMITRLETSRRRLEKTLATLTPEQMALPGALEAWCIKDYLAHLGHWEMMQVEWIEASQRGEKPAVPAEGLTFSRKHLAILNERIYRSHCEDPWDVVLAYFHSSHRALMNQLATLSEEDLFTPGRWPFAGGQLVGWYEAFAAHDDWAAREIRHRRKPGSATPQCGN
jgi:hypothetical protein